MHRINVYAAGFVALDKDSKSVRNGVSFTLSFVCTHTMINTYHAQSLVPLEQIVLSRRTSMDMHDSDLSLMGSEGLLHTSAGSVAVSKVKERPQVRPKGHAYLRRALLYDPSRRRCRYVLADFVGIGKACRTRRACKP